MLDLETMRGQLASQVLASGLYSQSLKNHTVSATVDDCNAAPALWSEFANTCSITLGHSPKLAYKEAFVIHLIEQVRRLFATSYAGPFCDFPSTDSFSCSTMEAVPSRSFPFVRHMNLVSSPQEGLSFDLDDFIER